jgi:hypothetical protein
MDRCIDRNTAMALTRNALSAMIESDFVMKDSIRYAVQLITTVVGGINMRVQRDEGATSTVEELVRETVIAALGAAVYVNVVDSITEPEPPFSL